MGAGIGFPSALVASIKICLAAESSCSASRSVSPKAEQSVRSGMPAM